MRKIESRVRSNASALRTTYKLSTTSRKTNHHQSEPPKKNFHFLLIKKPKHVAAQQPAEPLRAKKSVDKIMVTGNNETARKPTNEDVIKALKRLSEALQADVFSIKSPPHLSHYREIPTDVQTAYNLLFQGASMIHATSTKYTLVGKTSMEEQQKLAPDLLRGCEIIGASIHVFFQDGSGCSRSVRESSLRACMAILLNVTHLVESFTDGTAMDKNIGAQKTGAVWESCDTILKKLLPQGNRNAMRRELFTWTRECSDTMEEFQELIDLGPCENSPNNKLGEAEEEEEDLFGGEDQQYSDADLPIARACLGIVKCSRGCMKVTLEACEALGMTRDEKYFDSIAHLHELARAVGEGMTDLGSLLYPPLTPAIEDLRKEMERQIESIKALQDCIISLESMPPQVTELANVLRGAADTRKREVIAAIANALAS